MRFKRRSFGRRSDFGRRFEDDRTPKPVNVGEEYDVEINEVGSRGDGIARIKNFVVFVANGKKGEKTRVKIKEVRNRFATAEKIGEVTAEEVATEEAVEETEEETEEPMEETEEEPEDY